MPVRPQWFPMLFTFKGRRNQHDIVFSWCVCVSVCCRPNLFHTHPINDGKNVFEAWELKLDLNTLSSWTCDLRSSFVGLQRQLCKYVDLHGIHRCDLHPRSCQLPSPRMLQMADECFSQQAPVSAWVPALRPHLLFFRQALSKGSLQQMLMDGMVTLLSSASASGKKIVYAHTQWTYKTKQCVHPLAVRPRWV